MVAKREEKEAVRLAAEADEHVFKVFAERWIDEMLGDASADYRKKVGQRLANHAYPQIGKKPLDAIKPRDILAIVERLRNTPATAEKVTHKGVLRHERRNHSFRSPARRDRRNRQGNAPQAADLRRYRRDQS
ncbi:phage integrase central domain-containing protein [Burkholderia cenocepacia]|uniref:phage integrase central domain-containing protein n=1 Tax=Burkholderia cenocepacia TaxID=95486 RepID=UPI003907EDA1